MSQRRTHHAQNRPGGRVFPEIRKFDRCEPRVDGPIRRSFQSWKAAASIAASDVVPIIPVVKKSAAGFDDVLAECIHLAEKRVR